MNFVESKNTIEVKFEEVYDKVINTKDYAKMCTEMHLRVCAYARVSTDSEEQQTSYNSQIKHYKDMIEANPKWDFVEVYADEGITGTQLKKRDNFNRMIQDALDGKIDMIIAKSISRFARNTVDTLNIVRLLRSYDVDVYFEKENIHTLSITNELFLTLYSAFAQGESESISENMKAGLQFKMKRGEPVGCAKCYGYDWIENPENKGEKILVINDEQAKVVIRIFREYAKGYGTTLICKGLNNDNIPSPKGRKWKPETVRRILFNEKYVGDLRTGKTFVESVITHKKKINQGHSKQYYTENHHEAIITRELRDKAFEMYSMRSDKYKAGRDKYSRRYAFSSKIYCGCCGERFVRKSYLKNKKDPNSRVIIWGCRSRNNDIECDNRINYKDEELKAMFVAVYNQLFRNKDKYAEMFLKKVDNVLNDKSVDKEKIRLEKERETLLSKQSKLIDLSISSAKTVSKEVFDNKMNELNEDLKRIDNRLKEIRDSERIRDKKTEQLEKIMEVLENKKHLDEFDDDVFESIVERILIGEKKEDGTFDFETIKFILKTGEVLTGGTGINILNLALQETAEKNSSLNVTIEKVGEDKEHGLTAYMQHKRLCVHFCKWDF